MQQQTRKSHLIQFTIIVDAHCGFSTANSQNICKANGFPKFHIVVKVKEGKSISVFFYIAEKKEGSPAFPVLQFIREKTQGQGYSVLSF